MAAGIAKLITILNKKDLFLFCRVNWQAYIFSYFSFGYTVLQINDGGVAVINGIFRQKDINGYAIPMCYLMPIGTLT